MECTTPAILTQLGELECIGRVDDVNVRLQLESPGRHVEVVVEHRELKRRLYLIGALLEDCTCKEEK